MIRDAPSDENDAPLLRGALTAASPPDVHAANDSTGELTTDDRVLLRIALDMGYFDGPKATALVNAADDRSGSTLELSHRTLREIGAGLRETDVLHSRE